MDTKLNEQKIHANLSLTFPTTSPGTFYVSQNFELDGPLSFEQLSQLLHVVSEAIKAFQALQPK